ncbi:cobalamin-dependent protein [bacterium]|nr:cobalamin-dependent protein [bacterium]
MSVQPQMETFINCLEAGDRRRCFRLIQEWEQQKLSDEQLYTDILIPSLIFIGTAWESNRHGIVEEHVATQIIKSIVASKAVTLTPRRDLGKTAMVGCVPNEHHEIGSMLLANMLESEGWKVYLYGSSVPQQELVKSATNMKPDLICLTMKSIGCLESTLQLLVAIRRDLPGTKIMLGGMHIPSVRAILSEHVDILADNFIDGIKQAEMLAGTST